VSLATVADAVRGNRYRFSNEEELQRGIAEALDRAGLHADREVKLDARNRIDFLVEGVGIEVKVASNPSTVARQLRRYAEFDRIEALLLVTTRVRHLMLPPTINGKRVVVLSLAEAGL
jgi:hypothetical protein